MKALLSLQLINTADARQRRGREPMQLLCGDAKLGWKRMKQENEAQGK